MRDSNLRQRLGIKATRKIHSCSGESRDARTQSYTHKSTNTCMNTRSYTHLFLLLTLVVSPHSPLLSCTAPDKQHQKQHSHQPQRKHPFTCSGIYLLNPPVAMCVCVSLSHCLCVFQDPYLHLSPSPYFLTLVC